MLKIDSDSINVLIASFVNGPPLLMYSYALSSRDLIEVLNGVLGMYREYVTVQGDDNNIIVVVHRAPFRKAVEVLARALLLSKILEDSEIERKGEVSLDEIEQLVSRIFKRPERYRISISRDCFEIRKALQEKTLNPGEYVLLAHVLWGQSNICEEFEQYVKDSRYKRNFLAYSGLEGCVTEIRRDDNGAVKLRYRAELRKYILEATFQGLSKL